jgi:hypothetical protein
MTHIVTTTTGYILFSSDGHYEERKVIPIAYSNSKSDLEEMILNLKQNQEIINRYIDFFNSGLASFEKLGLLLILKRK